MSQTSFSKYHRYKFTSPRQSKRKIAEQRPGFMHKGDELLSQCIKSKVIKVPSPNLDSSLKLTERHSTQTSTEEISLKPTDSQISITITSIPTLNRSNAINILKQLENLDTLDQSKYKLRTKAFNFVAKHARSMLKSDRAAWYVLEPSTIEALLNQALSQSLEKPAISNEQILDFLLQYRGLSSYSELLCYEQSRSNDESFGYDQIEPSFIGTVQRTYHKDILNCYPEFSISGTFWQIKTRFVKNNLLQVTMVHSPKEGKFQKGQILMISYKVVFEGDFTPTHYHFMPVTIGVPWEFVIEEKDISGDLSTAPLKMKLYSKIEPVNSAILMHLAGNLETLINQNLYSLPKSALLTILKSNYLEAKTEGDVLEVLAKWTQENPEAMGESIQDLISCVKWEYVSLERLLEISRKYTQIKQDPTFRGMFKQALIKQTQEVTNSVPRRSYSKLEVRKRYSSVKDLSDKVSCILFSSQYTPNYKELNSARIDRLSLDYSSKQVLLSKLKDELCSISLPTTSLNTPAPSDKFEPSSANKTLLEFPDTTSESCKTTDKSTRIAIPKLKTRDARIESFLERLNRI